MTTNDPHNLLTEAQRVLIYQAVDEASLLRDRAIVEAEMISKAEGRVKKVLDLSPGGGRQYTIFQNAVLDGVRLVLAAEVKAFRGRGLFGRRFREIIKDWAIDALANSFELTLAQKHLLSGELNLYRQTYDLPEWLVVPKDETDPEISPLCQLSKESLKRLIVARRRAEGIVDALDRSEIERISRWEASELTDRILIDFARSGVMAYLTHLVPSVYEEWNGVVVDPQIPEQCSGFIGRTIVQLAVEHTGISHHLAGVSDQDMVGADVKPWLAKFDVSFGTSVSPSRTPHGTDTRPPDVDNCGRRATVEAYLKEVFDRTGRRLTKKDFWQEAGYRSRTEFERWQRCDKNTTEAARKAFERVLTIKPHLKP